MTARPERVRKLDLPWLRNYSYLHLPMRWVPARTDQNPIQAAEMRFMKWCSRIHRISNDTIHHKLCVFSVLHRMDEYPLGWKVHIMHPERVLQQRMIYYVPQGRRGSGTLCKRWLYIGYENRGCSSNPWQKNLLRSAVWSEYNFNKYSLYKFTNI